MKKKILMFLLCIFAVVGICVAAGKVVKRASDDPCGKCNIADENRECGKCGSFLYSKYIGSEMKGYKVYYTYSYTCKSCHHTCYHTEKAP